MKSRLQQHVGDRITISTFQGKPDVLTFHRTVSEILYELNKSKRSDDPKVEKLKITEAAAALIRHKAIRSISRCLCTQFGNEFG